jgi:hypothetical protein
VKIHRIFWFLLLVSNITPAQVVTTAVPFLLIPASPEGNGLGGISSSVMTSDPLAIIANPGQLGMQSLTEYLGASVTTKTSWLPAFNLSDVYILSQAGLVGAPSREFVDLPVDISIGLGFSKVYLNLGQFAATTTDPNVLQTYNGYEQSSALSVGIGIEYGARLGIGISAKSIESHLAALGTSGGPVIAQPKTRMVDYGAILNVPIDELFFCFSGAEKSGFCPVVDVNLSYGRSNVGGSIWYVDESQSDPLPRLANLGASTELGVAFRNGLREWNLFSFTIAREAYDLLIWKDQLGRFTYKSGSGNLSFFRNIIRGVGSDKLNIRKGLQVNLLEVVYVQWGSMDEPGLYYSATGYGIRLSGVLKAIRLLDPSVYESGTLGYLVRHLDLQYSRSSYGSGDESPIDGTTFNGIALIIH